MIDPAITTASCAALERAINSALSLDATTQTKLAKYQGRVIGVACTSPEIIVYFRIDKKIAVMQRCEIPIDAQIEGAASAWLDLLSANDKAAALINGDLNISGDSHVFMELKELAESIDLDWEGYIAQFIGDIPAHFIGKAAETAAGLGKQVRRTLHRTVDDFLHEEARILPTRIEVNNFYSDLRKLEMQIDRLDARITRATKNAATPTQDG